MLETQLIYLGEGGELRRALGNYSSELCAAKILLM